MPKKPALVGVIVGLLVLAACTSSPGQGSGRAASSSREVVVFAAASLSESFAEMSDPFLKSSGARPTYNFAGSNQLRAQIEQGARADVFASANEKETDALVEADFVHGTPRIFATNRLVVVTPRDNPGKVDSLLDLARPGLRLVLAGPNVPVGGYSIQMLDKMSTGSTYGMDFKERVLRNVISNETDVKQVLAKVQLGEGDAGVVYSSDVTPRLMPDLRTIQVPDAFNVIARYPISVVKEGRETALGQAFVDFVLSPQGQTILEKHNFVAVR